MASRPDPEKKDHPSTYVVQDRTSELELVRLDEQDQMYTTLMGGVLPEQTDPARFQQVLDVGCGPGGWLIQTAQTYPAIAKLRGIDISANMVASAQSRAETARVSDRVTFQTGDALRRLDFPDNSFDLVNQRLGMSFLRKWDWPTTLREYQRVCKRGGVIRITESSLTVENNSPALSRLFALFQEAFYQAGHVFAPEPEGVIGYLAEQMEKYGIADIQTRRYTFAYHTNPQALQAVVNDLHRGYRTMAPFLRKWVRFTENYEDLYQQMVQETQQPDLQLTTTLLTAWGTTQVHKNRPRL